MTFPPRPHDSREAEGLEPFLADCSTLGVAIIRDADLTAAHTVDWTGRWRGATPAVLRPGHASQVAGIVAAARRHRVALVPQGGNTGLVGGSVPQGGEVVVDLRRLNVLGAVDSGAAQVTVGAGATLAVVNAHTAPQGLVVAVDLASRDTATIGGMVATNAGGLHVLRYGSMRAQVLGLEAVLGSGDEVQVNLGGLIKDNTGYDLAGLLCGSEGTLGIVTAVRLRLVRLPTERAVVLFSVTTLADAVALLPVLRQAPNLHAVEVMRREGMEIVARYLGEPMPLASSAGIGLLVEIAGDGDVLAEAGALVDAIGTQAIDTSVAVDSVRGSRLWRWRDAHPDAAAALGLVHKADITLPIGRLVAAVAQIDDVVASAGPGSVALIYGHLADGNLHVNVVGPGPDDDLVIRAVLDLVLEHGGSVSAEHGVGVAKRDWIERQRGTAAVAAMRAIKSALDPDGVLNPRLLLP